MQVSARFSARKKAVEIDKIIQDLNRRFAEPLPEFYKRRIIFWIDEDQEFVDKLDEIKVDGAKIVALTGFNNLSFRKFHREALQNTNS